MKKRGILSNRIIFLGALLALSLAYPRRVSADGAFFYDVEVEKLGNSAESPNQRALIIHDGEKETLVLQVKYSGNVENFAWVVPIPVLPEENSITTDSDSIFQKLHEVTQPRLYKIKGRDGWGKLGGGGDGPEDVAEIVPKMGIQVWERLQVGPYAVAVLSGSSSQALIDWLTSNGYHFPKEASSTVDFYVRKNWYFLASRVTVQSALPKSNSMFQAGLPALKMTFKTEKPVFPLRISELSSAKENEIELYVAAPHRMACESYQSAAMQRDEVQRLIEDQIDENKPSSSTGLACACKRVMDPGDEEPEYDYEGIFRNKVASFDRPTFIVECAVSFYVFSDPYHDTFHGYFKDYFAPDTHFWLTRFRTFLPPDGMQDDVTFIADPNGDEWLMLYVYIEEESPNSWSAAAISFPGIFMLPLFFVRKIRKRYSRQLTLSILLIILATA